MNKSTKENQESTVSQDPATSIIITLVPNCTKLYPIFMSQLQVFVTVTVHCKSPFCIHLAVILAWNRLEASAHLSAPSRSTGKYLNKSNSQRPRVPVLVSELALE